jgi:hypothetical protein
MSVNKAQPIQQIQRGSAERLLGVEGVMEGSPWFWVMHARVPYRPAGGKAAGILAPASLPGGGGEMRRNALVISAGESKLEFSATFVLAGR